ncbi:putative Nuclear pore complex protein Nup155 [Hypsibius exemplaris]|uniref:Nuclear pore complex protein Nup155 n=1 Tax=Hypsibius exemplaris TaxID=2072580 RepID=A0A1W0X0F7_HYPEX|nr:putative Nuclear pore complex protein Nup155 [Hypsibius exemplaris]
MFAWNPTSYSTPLEKPMRHKTTGQTHVSDLSGIIGSPNFERDLNYTAISSPRAQSSMLLQPESRSGAFERPNNAGFPVNSRERVMSAVRLPEQSALSAPVVSGTSFSSLLTPKLQDDHHDSVFHTAVDLNATGLPSFSSNEKVDLEHANCYLQECIVKDLAESDIADQMIGTNAGVPQSPSASGAHPDDYTPDDVGHFRITRELPISEAIARALADNQSGYRAMGCFPELSMVYAFIETKLYVWPWDNCKLITTVEYPEFITAVGLLPTWSAGFLYLAAPFVIVVATLTEVLFTKVLAVGSNYDIDTSEYAMRTSTNDLRYNKIQTTREGRVFLGGMEGHVSELQNIKQTMFTKWLWFGPRLANCTLAVYERIASSLPGFHLLFRKEPVVQMVVDDARKILYTLRKDNNVDLYDLGVDGTAGTRHIHLSFQNIVSQAMPLLRNVDRLQIKQIVSVHPVDVWESNRYPFFLLSSAGLRLYFSLSPRGVRNDRPREFVLGHIRFPPGHNPSAPIPQVTAHLNVTDSFYVDGTIMMVTPSVDLDEQDEIISASNDLYIYEQKYRESVSVTSLPNRVEAIALVQQYPQESLVFKARSLALNQLMTSRRLLVVVTMKKCFLLEKAYPVDIMEKVLRSHSPMSNQVREFIEWLPPFQGCFLALHLACITTSGEICRMATRVLRVYGGEPTIESVRTVSPQRPSSSPRSNVKYSAKHDAFYYLFGRIVAPLWDIHPFVFGAEYKGAIAWISGIPAVDIAPFIEQLSLVKRYLEANWNDLFYPGRTMGRPGLPAEDAVLAVTATKAEMASIKSLASLMENSMQLLRLWDYLIKEGLTQVLDYVMKVFTKETLVALTFSDLLVDATGKMVVDSVIKAIHQRYVDEGTDTESVLRVSSYLQELCPKLFDNDDAVTMKVLTMIDKAKQNGDAAGSSAMLEHALNLIRPNATIFGLREILDRLTEKGFYEAAVELCGLAALQSDPQNYAVRFAIDRETPNDLVGRTAVEQRYRYYEMITKSLSDLESLASSRGVATQPASSVNLVMKPSDARMKLEAVLDWIYTHSSDVLLHFHVFEWSFTVCDRYATASNSPYLKDYLLRKLASLGPSDVDAYVRFLKLLAECAERLSDKWTAAQALSRLALHEVAQIAITERVEYLSRCELLCQTLKLHNGNGELSEFVSNVRIHFTLANVQKDIYTYVEEKSLGVVATPDTLARLTFDLLDAMKLFTLTTEINAPQWTLVILSVCGEPPNTKVIVSQWGKFLANVLDYAGKKNLRRDARVSLITTEITKIRSHLSPADQYCALDSMVEGFEARYVTVDSLARNDPAFPLDCIVNGLGVEIFAVVDVYRRLFEKYTADPTLAPHLLRVHMALVNTLLEDNSGGRQKLPKERRRLLLSSYARTLDGYLRTAMRQQLADDDILAELQQTSQRLAGLTASGRL